MYNYIQNIDSEEPIMLINKHIGFDEAEGQGIDGAIFQQELMLLDSLGKKRIQVWINSVGGIVMDGYNICNAILKSKTPVDTYCQGLAASIAGVIFQTGRKRIMADYGILMYHNPYAGDKTNSPMLESMKDSLNQIIRNRCNMDQMAVQSMMDNTSFINASDAKVMGLCDSIESTAQLNTKYMPKTQADTSNFYNAANKVLNKLFHQTDTKMLKVLNKLGLNDNANEESILSAIGDIENKAKKTAEDLEAMKNALSEMEANYNQAKQEFEDCKNELDAINEAKAALEETQAEEKAAALIDGAVKDGKIKNDAAIVEGWKAQAKANFESTKSLLDGIALNKSAVRIPTDDQNKRGDFDASATMAVEMAMISNRLEGKEV